MATLWLRANDEELDRRGLPSDRSLTLEPRTEALSRNARAQRADPFLYDRKMHRMNSNTMEQLLNPGDALDVLDCTTDFYFSVDVETDGPIPGSFSMLSFALVCAGTYDGNTFQRPKDYNDHFYRELKPISTRFQIEALNINKLDRNRLLQEGEDPRQAMDSAFGWINNRAAGKQPVLVAYPLSFDWTWLYWYFTEFCSKGSPFSYSQCFDIKTALSVKSRQPISISGRSRLPKGLASQHLHTHHALDDAIAQAEIFANIFQWEN